MSSPGYAEFWKYKETGNTYRIEFIGIMKIETQEWVESITYTCVKTRKVFTRDAKTFIEKFEPVKEIS